MFIIWLKNDSSLIVSNVHVSKAIRELLTNLIKIKANGGQSLVSISGAVSNSNNGNVHAGLTHSSTDYDFSGDGIPNAWDTMTYKSQSDDNTNALKDVYRATDQLVRFFTNDIGSYYQYRKQFVILNASIC